MIVVTVCAVHAAPKSNAVVLRLIFNTEQDLATCEHINEKYRVFPFPENFGIFVFKLHVLMHSDALFEVTLDVVGVENRSYEKHEKQSCSVAETSPQYLIHFFIIA